MSFKKIILGNGLEFGGSRVNSGPQVGGRAGELTAERQGERRDGERLKSLQRLTAELIETQVFENVLGEN